MTCAFSRGLAGGTCGAGAHSIVVLPNMPGLRFHRVARNAVAAVIALLLLVGVAPASSADTKTQISAAELQLSALEKQISAGQAAVEFTQADLRTVARQVEQSRALYDAIQAQILQTKMYRMDVEGRYRAIKRQIADAASQAYMRGPAYSLEALFAASSLSEVTYVVGYARAIVSRDSELADQAHRLSAELQARIGQESALEAQRAAALSQLADQQNELTARFADQQARLASLAQARAQVSTLLVRLRKQLRAEEIAAALAALANGTPLSFGKWATAFLGTIGAPIVRNNLVVMVAWETAEFTSAAWNPLATTYPMPGSTTYNGSGVRNYGSLQQGLQATLATLRQSGFGYEAILANLEHNADPMTTAHAINDSSWCSGCANGQYVIDLIPTVEQYYDSYAGSSA